METNWDEYIADYLRGDLLEPLLRVFQKAMANSPDLREEVRLRRLEVDAMDRFYAYTRDKPDGFPDDLPGTKLYFAGLFTTALFLGTFDARTRWPKSAGPVRHKDETPPPGASDRPEE